jgi:hypothetical protein
MHVLLPTDRSRADVEPVMELVVQLRTLGAQARV